MDIDDHKFLHNDGSSHGWFLLLQSSCNSCCVCCSVRCHQSRWDICGSPGSPLRVSQGTAPTKLRNTCSPLLSGGFIITTYLLLVVVPSCQTLCCTSPSQKRGVQRVSSATRLWGLHVGPSSRCLHSEIMSRSRTCTHMRVTLQFVTVGWRRGSVLCTVDVGAGRAELAAVGSVA